MANQAGRFRILIATDGSRQARAAIATTLAFPWPVDAHVRVVAARRTRAEYRRSILLAALDRSADAAAGRARRALSRRWPEIEAVVVDRPPAEGILEEAGRFGADVIVLGWRGHGAVRRLLMGSTSRAIVRAAPCAVLVVRRSARVRRLVIGLDRSPMAARALALASRLAPPAGGRVVLVTAVEPLAVPSQGMVPGARAVARDVKRLNARREREALQRLGRAASRLRRAGWQVRTVLASGEPLRELLAVVTGSRSSLLVVGARGASPVRHLLLGSVAQGALDRSPVPVLVVR
ncbi:MAG: universal stress protein [Acidobacteria bacterium]|nr:universal stress protein [Acidobacteriota bacterium]